MPTPRKSLLLTLTVGLCVQLILMASLPHPEPLLVLFAGIAALVLLGTIATMSLPGAAAPRHPEVPPAQKLPEDQIRLLDELAALPHCRRIQDGSVIDFVHGIRLAPCRCGAGDAHLALHQGDSALVGFLPDDKGLASLRQYVSVQQALARRLMPEALP